MKGFQAQHVRMAILSLCLFCFCTGAKAESPIDATEFIEAAAEANAAEVALGKLVLQESESAEVKQFAQHMIDDHTIANNELKTIAKDKNIDFENDPSLADKIKKQILSLRNEESFDLAYASNQRRSHELTVELFKRATQSDDADIRAYAKKYLPKLEHHFIDARQLVEHTERVAHQADVNADLGSETAQ